MKLDTETLPGSRAKVLLTAEPEDVDKAFGKAYDRLRAEGRVTGFRPGKAPDVILRRHYNA